MSLTRKSGAIFYAVVVALTLASAAPPQVQAHGGQIETGEGPKGPVKLTDAQIKALGLQTVSADARRMESLLHVHGSIEPLVDAQASVTLRFSGIVRMIYANPGDVVRKGDRLALVESRVVGDPPPTVTITSPIAGVVDARSISVGQGVETGSVLFHVSDLNRMRAVGRVYEEDLGKVKVGQLAHVKLLAYPNEVLSGTISQVGASLDLDTRTAEVTVSLNNDKKLLKPNLFARIDVAISSADAALTVPNAAILEAAGEKFVFVRQGNTFSRNDIQTGAADDQFTEVTDGLVPGDEVVTVGAREVYTQWLTGGSSKNQDAD